MNSELLLSYTLDIAEEMLICGAEVYRVEDCVNRICTTYNAKRIDVFTITSTIIATFEDNSGNKITQTRRIEHYHTNLARMHKLNHLSREICTNKPDLDYIHNEFQKIVSEKPYNLFVQCAAYAVIGSSFTCFFGGHICDGILSGLIAVILRLTLYLIDKAHINRVLENIVLSFLMCFCAFFIQWLNPNILANKIIIGNIMLLIPGVGLTNSLRDMISGDTMAGMLRFCEACLIALAIASGYFLAALLKMHW